MSPMAPAAGKAAPMPVIHRHEARESWIAGALAQLRDALEGGQAQRLLLSGGSTPAPLYHALAAVDLDWPRLELGLVDERWLPDGDANRNDTLVRTHLLAHQPRARLQPLARPGLGWKGSAQAANHWWDNGPVPAAAVLGMGSDGHIASLFPAATDLQSVVRSPCHYGTFDATGCPGAQSWPQRLTLTPAGLATIGLRLLLLRGQDKLDTLMAALEAGDPARTPVLHALAGPSPLQVHWCP